MSSSADNPHFLTCACQHCGGGIEFDASGFLEGAEQVLECPHCQRETTVLIPTNEQAALVAEVPPVIADVQANEAEQARIINISKVKAVMRAQLVSGKPVFLYESLFVPVDSVLNEEDLADEFDISRLRRLGIYGWEVVQSAPKTLGIGLKNAVSSSLFGEEWGGGIGGNVTGVYFVLKKSLGLAEITDDPTDELAAYIDSHMEDFSTK